MSGGKRCAICKLAWLLMLIGGLNWGLVGLFQVDLVAKLLGAGTMAARVVYGLVGAGAVVSLLSCLGACPCTKGSCESK